jgi:tripartite ATP-independent transporter DctM subunit
MSIEVITILLFAAMLILLATGIPIVFAMGAVSIIFAFFLIGPDILGFIASGMFRLMNVYALLAGLLFIFMGAILERSGVADDLYHMMSGWFGGLPGGLAIGTVVICTIMAAMTGVSAAATVTMALIAFPAMFKRGYNTQMTLGCIAAAGGLGQLIPPSTMMIIWALWANESVGQMFIGGILPGLLLSALYIVYILIRCTIQPKMGPPIPLDQRMSWKDKLTALRAVIFPVLIIIGVLGSIFGGIATPTEAAAIGSLLSLISGLVYRRLNLSNLSSALRTTLQVTCMFLWIMVAGSCFSATFTAIGGQELIKHTLIGIGANRWIILIGMQIVYLILGCFMDGNAIMMLSVPVFIPVVAALGFNTLWFGILFVVNMELAFITPPFGANLFYIKAVAPKGVTMSIIYRSVAPFIGVQLVALALCVGFPQIILFLPNMVFGVK